LIPKPPPGADPTATRFTYAAGATRLPETAAPGIKNRSWTNLSATARKNEHRAYQIAE
jgi:hypothetical protein